MSYRVRKKISFNKMDIRYLELKREVRRLQDEIDELNRYIDELKQLTGFWY